MNLVKIADMLKNASDQSLAQEIQNPTGSVPSYMVLSELERRKKLRGSIMQPTDNKSVSEELGAEFGGIAGLDQAQPDEYGVAQDQEQPQGYAQGGKVVHAAKGWFGEETGDYGDTDPGYSSDVQPGGLFRTDKILKAPLTKEQAEAYYSLTKSGLSSENAMRMARGDMPTANTTPAGKPVSIPPVIAPSAAPTGNGAGNTGRGAGRNTPPSSPPSSPASAPAQSSNMSLYDTDLADARKAGIEGLQSYGDYLKTALAENKAQKAENAWQALTMAGLGILGGKSQNWQENVGAGAQMGMQQFMGMEQARQKEGRAMAMDMAQSGLKKSEILSNLAKAGFEGEKAKGMVAEAFGKAKYYTEEAGVRRAAANASNSGLKAENAQVASITKEIAEWQAQAKLPMNQLPTKQAEINAKIASLQQQRAKIKGYESSAGASAAPSGGSWSVGQNGRMVYTPGG